MMVLYITMDRRLGFHEIDIVVALLSASFAESIMFLAGYETLLGLLVKPYFFVGFMGF